MRKYYHQSEKNGKTAMYYLREKEIIMKNKEKDYLKKKKN